MLSLRRAFALSLFVLLTGCLEPPNVPRADAPSFTQYQPFNLDVATIKVTEEYRSPLQKPNVEHLFLTTPAEGLKIWVKDRLRAVGSSRSLQVIIKDASVKETALERTKGVKGAFTNDQAFRYDARLEVEMRIYGERAMSDASISVVATRSDTLPENASPIKRDQLYTRMTKELLDVTNAELEKNIYQYFSNYIQFTPN